MRIDDKIFNMSINKVNTIKETEYLITLKNITDYKAVKKSIIKEQQELEYKKFELEITIEKLRQTSKVGARNYVARELHDIIGHSLVVTVKLLDVAKLYFYKDKKLSKEAVNDSLSSIELGIYSMENIKLSEIKTKLSFKGLFYNLDEKTFDVINKVCLELVTNSIKHSQAK